MSSRALSLAIVAAVFVGLLPGCDKAGPPPRTEANVRDRLMSLGIAYNRIGKSPKDEATFRAALKSAEPSALSRFHIHSPDELFVSPRDNQPFVIRYGTPPGVPGTMKDILAYEQQGAGGTRFVLYSDPYVEEVDAAKWKQIAPAETPAP